MKRETADTVNGPVIRAASPAIRFVVSRKSVQPLDGFRINVRVCAVMDWTEHFASNMPRNIKRGLMAGIGDNHPPGQIEFTSDTSMILGAFLKDHPVILTEEEARAAKLLIDRSSACIKDLEAERDGKVRPLNMQVKAINDEYRPHRATLERVTQELLVRIDGYRKVEEDKRRKIAEEAKRAAEEAEHRAREAEQREREARSDAEVGVESDVGTAIVETDLAVAEAERAAHRAALAEKESRVRVGGGFGRVLTARTQETLFVVDGNKAICDLGWTQRITDAILSEAREFRKRWNKLPSGVESHVERSMTKKGTDNESL